MLGIFFIFNDFYGLFKNEMENLIMMDVYYIGVSDFSAYSPFK